MSSSQINLTWIDNSASETGYKIERKTTVTGTYAQIAQVGANVQSYSDTNGLDPNTRYYYRVRATNGTIDSGYSNEPFAVTFQVTPAPPSGLTITSVLSNRVSLSWTDNSNNETGFKIQRKTGITGTYADITTTGANVTAYNDSDTGLEMVLCITTGFVRPTRLETLRFPMKRVALHLWRNQPLLLQRQCRQVKSTLPGLIIRPLRQGTRLNERQRRLALMLQIDQVGANVQSYSDTNGLDPNTKYYYRIRATNGTIDSDYSNDTVRYDTFGCSSTAIRAYNYVCSIKQGQSFLERTTLTMKQASKSSGKQGLQERMPILNNGS